MLWLDARYEKTQTSAQGQIWNFHMSNFLEKWLDRYTIFDNNFEQDTELSLTFILITAFKLP